eukprot:CAMPEP_0202969598 /NCGR_PEP_ID=MMETSP1396-20130829/15404_1 /ASSEMBLY_ACC=CAM_ASM_000872 /TAXON_ID= /ORGANISM="Pseudokeronopsis sp., Strain Brazil" /LENGTH=115 /DNA_ID=CAMNT_0049697337 /DNA_START=146 /DNA_END=493 /DNA_ORIENTATION=+
MKVIEKFILQTAIDQNNFALRALLNLQALSEDRGQLYCNDALNFYHTLEATLVNGNLPLEYSSRKSMPLKSHEEYFDKKFKADYLGFQITFLDMLKRISVTLKHYTPQEERDLFL